jgi:hypothetical protein
MEVNWIALVVAALSTLVVGFIWYHPKVFGTIWMKESGMTEDKMKGTNMVLIFGMSVVYAFLIGIVLQFLTIHQWGAFSMIGGPDFVATAKPSYHAFMTDYSTAFRTFKHGALHGFLTGLLLILPVIGTNAMYERKSFKYTLVSSGFWIVCFTIMGGIICSWT